jgi:hypothetical protein
MLDSGNKNSGIASDVDQTVFVIPKDLANKMGVNVEDVIKKFNAEFKAKFGCHPKKMGIECMNGNDFYPDWRQRHSKEVLSAEARRVVHEKRKNPEAYRSEGGLKIQAEGRGWQALQEHQEQDEKIAKGDNTDTLAAYVRVFDAKDNEIELVGDLKMPIKIGELKVSKPQKGSAKMKVAMRKKAEDPKPDTKPKTTDKAPKQTLAEALKPQYLRRL